MVSIVLLLAACTTTPGRPGPAEQNLVEVSETDGGPVTREDCVPELGVVLNEVSPANVDALEDRNGESVDWIELYNPTERPLELVDWSLSDDGDEPRKWIFPHVAVPPGGFQLVYASGEDAGGPMVATWDTRVDQGSLWRYLEVVAAPAPDWVMPEYDDSGWPSGPSGFGNADGDDATVVAAHTVYVRVDVEVSADDLRDLVALQLNVDYDDAFVAYLNGVEVARAGIGTPGVAPAWDAFATSSHEATLYQELSPPAFLIEAPLDLLVEGVNTLALEVHDAEDSSDLTLVPFLSLGFGDERDASESAVLELPTNELYANFSLRADGERVRLYDPSGCPSDELDPVPLLADQSYGRKPDGVGGLGYFMEPTPGAPNLTESRPGFSPTPTFDPPPGYHAGGTAVTVHGGPAARIHVTEGGYEPTESDPPYTSALQTGTSDDEAAVFRARAWEDGLWPSRIGTATYLLHEPGPLPIVSLVTDPPNLWDDEIGIYAFGTSYDPAPPYYGANFWEDWEVPTHVELWEPDGKLGFQVDAGMQIHGNKSRDHGQKSLLVELGSRYGEGTIEHEVFPGLGIDEFDRLLFRAGGQDWHGCSELGCSGAHMRDGLMHGIAAGYGVDVLAYRPAELYLNGVYWGIYHINERPDLSYVESHHGYTDIDLLEQQGTSGIEGDPYNYDAMMEYLRTHDLADPDVYAHVRTLIDVDELQGYLAFEVFYANTDWPGNNIKYWRPRTPDGRWRWILYDTDFGLGSWNRSPDHDTLAFALEPAGPGWPNPPWATELFRLLVQSPEFTQSFINRYADLLNTALVPDVTRARLGVYIDDIALGMPRHIARWGTWTDGVTFNTMEPGAWELETAWIDEWLTERPLRAREHVVEDFGLAGTWTLSLAADPPGSGTFALTAVEVDGPFSGTYFRGVPVTVTAVPATGHTFSGWSDPTLGSSATVTLDPGGPLDLVARFD